MKLHKYFYFIGVLFVMSSFQAQGSAENKKKISRYHYCNVYLDAVCFGISQGDELNMKLPVDFFLYDLNLSFGGNVNIYYGLHPKDITEDAKFIKFIKNKDIKSCALHKIAKEKYQILCQLEKDDFVMDISLRGVSVDNYKYFNDFLYNFRKCELSDNNIKCTENHIFGRSIIEPESMGSE